MKIFIQEYATGGGLIQTSLDLKLVVEGFGMLRTLAQNFLRLNYTVITTLDERLTALRPFLVGTENHLINFNDNFIEKSKELIKNSDLFLIIAPGANDILSSILEEYQAINSFNLNGEIEFIDMATSKYVVYEKCSQIGIKYPRTILIYNKESYRELPNPNAKKIIKLKELVEKMELSYPLIIKPNDGVACEGLFLCKNEGELYQKLEKIENSEILIQEFIEGINYSATIFIGEEIVLLSINQQLLSISNDKSEYLGSICNVIPEEEEKMKSFLKSVLTNLKGVKGFIGIDFIQQEDTRDLYFIEINPRVTTSICGIIQNSSEPIDFLDLKKEESMKQYSICYFSKSNFEGFEYITKELYNSFINFNGIITPPIKIENRLFQGMIKGYGRNISEAKKNFEENESYILDKLMKSKNKY